MPRNPVVSAIATAVAAFHATQFENSEQCLTSILGRDDITKSEIIETLILRGKFRAVTQRWFDAVKDWDAVLAIQPRNCLVLSLLGKTTIQEKKRPGTIPTPAQGDLIYTLLLREDRERTAAKEAKSSSYNKQDVIPTQSFERAPPNEIKDDSVSRFPSSLSTFHLTPPSQPGLHSAIAPHRRKRQRGVLEVPQSQKYAPIPSECDLEAEAYLIGYNAMMNPRMPLPSMSPPSLQQRMAATQIAAMRYQQVLESLPTVYENLGYDTS